MERRDDRRFDPSVRAFAGRENGHDVGIILYSFGGCGGGGDFPDLREDFDRLCGDGEGGLHLYHPGRLRMERRGYMGVAVDLAAS